MNLLEAIVVVTNLGFTAGYDTAIHNPRWVAYDLEPHMVVKGKRPSCSFVPDPQIGAASDGEPFYRAVSGFDRGHLCPSADMAWNADAQRETFYYSNICPQRHALNAGAWLKTEEEVRKLAASGTVHVVVVPLDFWAPVRDSAKDEGRSANNGTDNSSVGTSHLDLGTSLYSRPTRFVKVAYGSFGARVWEVKE